MTIADNVTNMDLMLTTNGDVFNYVEYLKKYDISDMNEKIRGRNINVEYNTNNDLVYEFKIRNRVIATENLPDELVEDGKAYVATAYDEAYD